MLFAFPRANGNIRMDTGNFADYLFGSGTERVTFLYIVKNGDSTDALEAWDAPSNGELSVSFAVAQLRRSCFCWREGGFTNIHIVYSYIRFISYTQK